MERKIIIAIVVPIVVVVVVAAVVAGILLSKNHSSSPLSANYFGCKNGNCLPGQGSQTFDECKTTCESTPTSIGYGCNPKTGKCEIGYGTDDSTCSKSSPCKKLTYKCDTSTWVCNDTNDVTNVSQDKCDCNPNLTATPIEEGYVQPQFQVGDGINCKNGFTFIDEYGREASSSCWAGTCCETNFCGPFQPTPSDTKQCQSAKDETTCLKYATTNGCQWSNTDGCSVNTLYAGQCAKCTSDADCKTITDQGTCSPAGKCELSGVRCAQNSANTQYRSTSVHTSVNFAGICNGIFSQPVNPCVNEPDAYTCAKTMYISKCKDKNGLDWATNTWNCTPDTHY